jgi:hypothetical protein
MDQSIVNNPAEEKAWLAAHPEPHSADEPREEVSKPAKKAKSRTA